MYSRVPSAGDGTRTRPQLDVLRAACQVSEDMPQRIESLMELPGIPQVFEPPVTLGVCWSRSAAAERASG